MPTIRSAVTDAVNFYGNTTPYALIQQYGSPLYVYNESVLRQRCRDLTQLSAHPGFRVNYSAKANTNPALLRIIRSEGCLVDAMSPGELHMNTLAGFKRDEILYVCNNVSADEMRIAAEAGLLLSVDSLAQLEQYGTVSPGGRVMIRMNPGIGAGHHQKVITAGKETKFGICPEDMPQVQSILSAHKLTLAGLNQHIGSLFMEPQAYLDAVDVLLLLASELRGSGLGKDLQVLDFGGGFGIPYHKYEQQPRLDCAALGQGLHERLTAWSAANDYNGYFYVEPGRYLVAECGILLGTVTAVKHNGTRCYVGTDIGFNQLMRPVMYDAFHDIEIYRDGATPDTQLIPQTVVGNICESGDILAKDRELPKACQGDLLAMLDAGAYGFVMASSYNQRPRPAEVLIDANGNARLIRRRESLEDLTRLLAE